MRKKIRYVPTVFEHFVAACVVDGKPVHLALWDTAGKEEYDRLRFLAYSKAQIILIGFPVDSPDSLNNVKRKWAKEVRERCPDAPILLVGLKKDLRDNCVAWEELQKRFSEFTSLEYSNDAKTVIGAKEYFECSSLTGDGIDQLFEAVTRTELLPLREQYDSGCCIVS
ncbi:Rho GTPase [Didymella glomerata]|uniref:Rho GTPase n=1 Tax=Didymella glomerata TaxID=749621 RepID=A0A9W8WPY0_9PLEO|nr:Rho GTPase [Didymella glomerata]